jgi:hypothetical protein
MSAFETRTHLQTRHNESLLVPLVVVKYFTSSGDAPTDLHGKLSKYCQVSLREDYDVGIYFLAKNLNQNFMDHKAKMDNILKKSSKNEKNDEMLVRLLSLLGKVIV